MGCFSSKIGHLFIKIMHSSILYLLYFTCTKTWWVIHCFYGCSKGSNPITVGLPPAWVDLSEEISANVQRARTKMAELAKAHAKALMPSFGDGKEDQRAIESLTHEITGLIKKSERSLQRLSAAGLSEDSNVRKNVQVPPQNCHNTHDRRWKPPLVRNL